MTPTPDRVPFADFFAAWRGRSRAAFLRAVTDAHLLVPDLSATIRPLDPDQSTHKVDAAAAQAWWDLHTLMPVRRRDGRRRGRVALGRSPDNDLVLEDARLSKTQAWLERVDGWLLGDAGSTNGTRLDGEAVPTHRGVALRSGSRIRLAEAIEVVFVEPAGLFGIVDRLGLALSARRRRQGHGGRTPTRTLPRRPGR